MDVDDSSRNDDASSSTLADYTSTLPEPLRTFAIRASFSSPSSDDDGEGNNHDDDGLDELELSVRGHLLELVDRLLLLLPSSARAGDAEDERCGIIVDEISLFLKNVTSLCIEAAMASSSRSAGAIVVPPSSRLASIKKLPFAVLEDAVDTLPLRHMHALWSGWSTKKSTSSNLSHVSSYAVTHLCSSHLFDNVSTKLSLLKVCNKMLKKIGTHRGDSGGGGGANGDEDVGYAEFAGGIMILLSTVFPLGERSAVNVLGTFNIGNVTKCDDDDDNNNDNDENHETIMTGNNGKDVTTTTTNEGTKKTSQLSLDNGIVDDNIGSSYEFYRKFWGLQRIFSNPHGTILQSRGGGGGGGGLNITAAGEACDTFFKDVMHILTVLEAIPVLIETATTTTGVGHNDIMVDDSSNSSSVGAATTTTVHHHHKYLTSRGLLPLQLRDSQLRMHFLIQLLIALSHLSSPNVTLPGTSVAEIRRRRQLTLAEGRAMQLLRSTTMLPPPIRSGERVARCVKWMLNDRETMWRAWKRAKCMPALDKVGSGTTMTAKTDGLVIREALLIGRKRKADAALLIVSADTTMMDTATADDDNDITIANLSIHTGRITGSLPTLVTLLEPYVEALDPENGIEGEYHPRNDKVYCWRALRMLARDQSEFGGQLQRFNMLRMRDGDFEVIVRDMWQKESRGDIGGSVLHVEYYAEKTEERHNSIGGEDDKVGGGGGDDEIMDDVSVGTTEEVAQARLEKGADFKKAAMKEASMMEDEMLNEGKDTAIDDEITQEDKDSKMNPQICVANANANASPDKNIKVLKQVLKNVVEATSEDAMGNVPDDEEEKLLSVLENIPEVEGTTKESSSLDNDINHNGNSFSPGGAIFKSKTWIRNDDKTTTSTIIPKVVDPAFNNKWTRNGDKSLASKEMSKKASDSTFSGKVDKEQNVESKSSPSRAKFIPAQKVQEERQKKFEPRSTSSRNDGKKRNQGDDIDTSQQSKHAKWEGRPAHHRGGSADSGKNRDSNSRSPALNNTNNPPSGNGNDEGAVGPPSQQGRGGWEPPRGRGGGREGSQGRGTGRGRGYQNNRGKQDRSNDSGGRDRR